MIVSAQGPAQAATKQWDTVSYGQYPHNIQTPEFPQEFTFSVHFEWLEIWAHCHGSCFHKSF